MKKKLYYACLILLLIIAVVSAKPQFNFDVTFKKAAQTASKNEQYLLSDFYWMLTRKINPDTPWVDFYMGQNKLFRAKKLVRLSAEKVSLLNQSLALYETELTKHPNEFATLCGIASVYKYKEDFENAVKYLKLALEQHPDDLWVIWELVYIHNECIRDYEKALFYTEKYLTIKPDEAEMFFSKAYALSGLDRKKEAVEWYKKYLATNPSNRVAPLVNLCGLEVELKDWDNAEKHINEGLIYNNTSYYLLSRKIDVLIHKKRYAEAEQIAKSFNHAKYLSYWSLAEIEYLKGNKGKSEKYFELAQKDAQNFVDKYCRGRDYDMYDNDGKCHNRNQFLKDFEQEKSKRLKELSAF